MSRPRSLERMLQPVIRQAIDDLATLVYTLMNAAKPQRPQRRRRHRRKRAPQIVRLPFGTRASLPQLSRRQAKQLRVIERPGRHANGTR